MTNLMRILLCTLAFLSFPAFSAEWKFLLDDGFGTNIYIDISNIKLIGTDQYQITMLNSKNNGKSFGFLGAKSQSWVMVFQCKKKKLYYLHSTEYSEALGKGEILMDSEIEPKYRAIQDIFFTADKAVFNFLCR